MHIRPYQPADLPEWRRMRAALWPDQTEPAGGMATTPDGSIAPVIPDHPRDPIARFACSSWL